MVSIAKLLSLALAGPYPVDSSRLSGISCDKLGITQCHLSDYLNGSIKQDEQLINIQTHSFESVLKTVADIFACELL